MLEMRPQNIRVCLYDDVVQRRERERGQQAWMRAHSVKIQCSARNGSLKMVPLLSAVLHMNKFATHKVFFLDFFQENQTRLESIRLILSILLYILARNPWRQPLPPSGCSSGTIGLIPKGFLPPYC